MTNSFKYLSKSLFLLVLILGACKNEPKVQNSNFAINVSLTTNPDKKIDSVMATTTMQLSAKNGFLIVDSSMTECYLNKQNLKIYLPSTINAARLKKLDLLASDNIYISDINAKISSPLSLCCFTNGQYCGKLAYTNLQASDYINKLDSINYSETIYLYCDRELEIKGEYLHIAKELSANKFEFQKFNLNLAKGWNAINYSKNTLNQNVVEIVYSSNISHENSEWIYITQQHDNIQYKI